MQPIILKGGGVNHPVGQVVGQQEFLVQSSMDVDGTVEKILPHIVVQGEKLGKWQTGPESPHHFLDGVL